MVGVFSFVSFADEATTDKPATETPAAGTDDSAHAGKIERAGQAAVGELSERAKPPAEGSNVQAKPRAVELSEQPKPPGKGSNARVKLQAGD